MNNENETEVSKLRIGSTTYILPTHVKIYKGSTEKEMLLGIIMQLLGCNVIHD